MGAKERRSREDGFSLLELVVVTIILGILATIAIAVFLTQRDKAQRSVAKSAIRNTVTYAEIVRDEGSSYSALPAAYAAEAPSSYSFTNEGSEDPQQLSLAAFDDDGDRVVGGDQEGPVLVIASQAAGTCLYVRLDLAGASDHRGHHDGEDCQAGDLFGAPGNGWP